ncbi:MAG TPA: serine/threonine-protein kinase [Humisphaera sp.]
MAQKLLQYDVVGKLGDGAKSTIYKVVDPATGRKFALKHVVRKEDKDIRYIEQMEAEFECSKHFNHPALRRSFDLKVTKTMLFKATEAFLVMELVEGRPLDESLPRQMPAILEVFIQAAGALHAMHKVGYVHCDIKPINIMITADGAVKVIDFGQSCKIGTVKPRLQGTPDWMAPEQVAVERKLPMTPQTDVFNLGATLYWALTGRTIPTAFTVNKKSDNAILADSLFQTPQQLNPEVPENLSKLVMECISTNPSRRPASMENVIQRLELVKYMLQKQHGAVHARPETVAPDLYEDEAV